MNTKSIKTDKEVHQLHESKHEKDSLPHAGKLGLYLFLGSLTMLFGASMVGFLIIRFQAVEWPPAGMPSLPHGLWLSTVILIASSVTMHLALKSVKKNALSTFSKWITATLILGLAFLIAQWFNWSGLIAQEVLPSSKNLYSFTFFMLTGLHALHVIGGIIILVFVTIKSFMWAYSANNFLGVEYCSIYWHYLDIVWIIIYGVLILVG